MPPVTILSPYSGRPVKIREHDLGRALRDEEGRVFYVVEDPEHGRYAARTRKGSAKDLQRYRQIESGVAKLEGDLQLDDAPASQIHDATGSKRRSPVGVLLLIVILAAVAAAGYIYLNHPQWFGLGEPVNETQEADDAEQSSSQSPSYEVKAVAQKTTPDPFSRPFSRNPSAPGLAAAPLTSVQTGQAATAYNADRPPLPDGMDSDPEPIFVAARTRPHTATDRADRRATGPVLATPSHTVPIALAAAQSKPIDFDDFHHTASGLRYKITHLTDGVSARAGNYLAVRYTAQTLDGKVLIDDASQSFILARGQAIRALDEGLAGIREGEQLRMLIPRGHSDTGSLPGIERLPDVPFLLDVQLVSVRPGVTYIIESPGDIDSRPCTPGDRVYVNYLAKVEGRDEIIDATVHRGQPMRITLGNNEVIKGLELGITGMRPGESRQLSIPPYLAYGKYAVAGGLIPENAVLSFRVTLVGIVEDDE